LLIQIHDVNGMKLNTKQEPYFVHLTQEDEV